MTMICRNRIPRLIYTLMALIGAVVGTSCSAATWHVTSVKDDGTAGTLRHEIAMANDGDTVDFQLSNCPCAIALTAGQIIVGRAITISGLGADRVSINGNSQNRIFWIYSLSGTTTISDLEFVDGFGSASGGAIRISSNAVVRNSIFRRNYACAECIDWSDTGGLSGTGGAIYVDHLASASISKCFFDSNGRGHNGGAISNDGPLILSDSVFFRNEGSWGGAIHSQASLSISNSIFIDNHAFEGGALMIEYSPAEILNSTIVHNSAESLGGGIATSISVFNLLTLGNSVISNNQAAYGPDLTTFRSDTALQIVSLGNNLISDRSGSFGYHKATCTASDASPRDLPQQDAKLSPVHMDIDTGLPVVTPNPDSPLIDAISIGRGPCDGIGISANDLRGISRPVGAGADIGAIEFVAEDDRIFCDRNETLGCTRLH